MYWFNPAAIATLMAAVLTDVFPVSAAEAPGLIFDTDICGDCDDVLALGMIHALQSRGACRLLAVTISVDHELAAPFVDAVNTFYGRGESRSAWWAREAWSRRANILSLVEEKEQRPLPLSSRPASGSVGPRRDGPPQDPGGPARSFGRDRPGRFLDQPGPAARVARRRAFAALGPNWSSARSSCSR